MEALTDLLGEHPHRLFASAVELVQQPDVHELADRVEVPGDRLGRRLGDRPRQRHGLSALADHLGRPAHAPGRGHCLRRMPECRVSFNQRPVGRQPAVPVDGQGADEPPATLYASSASRRSVPSARP